MSDGEVTALVPLHGAPRAVAFRNLDDVERFAELIYNTSLVPKEYKGKKGDVVGVIFFGLELGLNPLQALQGVMFVNGRPAVWGDTMLALIEASGLLEIFEELDPEAAMKEKAGRCTVKRRGRPAIVRTFSQVMAETAHLWGKDIWKAYPGRMLQMRARSWALRDAFSDILKGLYTVEEARDIELTPDASGTYTLPPGGAAAAEAPVTPSGRPPPASTAPSAPAADETPGAVREPEGVAGPSVLGEPASAPAKPSAVDGLTLEAIQTLPKTAVINKIKARLFELAPGSSPEAKDSRKAYMLDAFHVDGWTRVEVLGLTELRHGLWRLVEVGRTPERADDDDDIPFGDEGAAHADNTLANGEGGDAPTQGVDDAPVNPEIRDGYATLDSLVALEDWARAMGQSDTLRELLNTCPADPRLGRLVVPEQYARFVAGLRWAAAHQGEGVQG